MSHIIQQNIKQTIRDTWISDLNNVVTDLSDLLKILDLDELAITHAMLQAKKQFALRVPLTFVNRIKKGDPNDPLLRQVLCSEKEMIIADG